MPDNPRKKLSNEERIDRLQAKRKELLSTSTGGQGGKPRAEEMKEIRKLDKTIKGLGGTIRPMGAENSTFKNVDHDRIQEKIGNKEI